MPCISNISIHIPCHDKHISGDVKRIFITKANQTRKVQLSAIQEGIPFYGKRFSPLSETTCLPDYLQFNDNFRFMLMTSGVNLMR
jgi:hypothetical protein